MCHWSRPPSTVTITPVPGHHPAMRQTALLTALLLATTLPASAGDGDAGQARPLTTQEIIDASQPSDWRVPDPENTLYLELETGRVVIELAPAFAPEHVANIRTLAREHFWDGTSFYRSQDNFVVQFGDAEGEDKAKPKPLGSARIKLPAEFRRDMEGLKFTRLPDADGWAKQVGFVDGFPVGHDPDSGKVWLAHCYGTLGAGRNEADDSSIGAELYVTIGQSPRQLDAQLSVVGRVLQGMELLSTIKRGPPPMGFYENPAERTPIKAIRLASEVPEAERTKVQVLKTDSASFAAATEARRNRKDG